MLIHVSWVSVGSKLSCGILVHFAEVAMARTLASQEGRLQVEMRVVMSAYANGPLMTLRGRQLPSEQRLMIWLQRSLVAGPL